MSDDPPSQIFCTLVCAKKDECVKECNSLLDFIKQDQYDQKSLDVPGTISGQRILGKEQITGPNFDVLSSLNLYGSTGTNCSWTGKEGQGCQFLPPQED